MIFFTFFFEDTKYLRRNYFWLTGFLNCTGTVYFTRIGFPHTLPGFHFGIVLRTRMASASQSLWSERTTLKSDNVPSFSTTISMTLRPCTFPSVTHFGKWVFSSMNWISFSIPPGNSGISAMTPGLIGSCGSEDTLLCAGCERRYMLPLR